MAEKVSRFCQKVGPQAKKILYRAQTLFVQMKIIILPGASHVKSSVSIVVGDPDVSTVLDKRSNCSKVCIGSSSMQSSATESGRCVGAFPTLQSGKKFILKVF